MQNAAQTAEDFAVLPLDGFQLSRLTQALEGLGAEQLTWASGYLAGLAGAPQAASQADAAPSMTILFATQGGNARTVAEELSGAANNRGLATRLVSAENYRPRDLTRERLLVVVISTQGEGEPPESARELFRYLQGKKPPQLDSLRYAVFGLGDSSYALFSQAGKELDRLLQALGARALLNRVDADVDYQVPAMDWYDKVLAHAEPVLPAARPRLVSLPSATTVLPRYDRDHPYHAEVVDHRPLTTPDAIAEVHHLALAIDPALQGYRPGDALGVWVDNDPALTAEILRRTGLDGSQPVEVQGETLTLADALQSHLELTQLHPTVVSAWAGHGRDPELMAIAKTPARLREFASMRQFVDLLHDYPTALDAAALAGLLRPLQPRLYSIASSLSAYDDEAHLTVSTLRYQVGGGERLGAASGHLTRRIEAGDAVRIYLAENPTFRLPDSDDTPVIMIGAGTGIAPYRGFLQEREARGAGGRNWLVFGNRHFHRDFLYQTDWLAHRKAGLLDRISVAFSRDTQDRPYVQDRLREEGAALYRWLDEGAHLYVCGGIEMEKAVRATLQAVAATHGGLGKEQSFEFVEDLRAQGRYRKDVY